MNCVQSSINQFLITWDLHTLPDYEEDDDDANMYFFGDLCKDVFLKTKSRKKVKW